MPFTKEQFLNVFRYYNTSVFPMQIILILLACCIIALLFYTNKFRDRLINIVLSFLWLWMGIVYHITFFSSINKAAYLFGILFVIQSFLFVHWGVIREDIQFNIRQDWIGAIGWIFIVYALLIYPALGYMFGHSYPYQPTFGLPCPTTIFTFGIFIFSSVNKKAIYIIPVLWSLLGFTAALNMGIIEDIGLLIAGLFSLTLVLLPKKLAFH